MKDLSESLNIYNQMAKIESNAKYPIFGGEYHQAGNSGQIKNTSK